MNSERIERNWPHVERRYGRTWAAVLFIPWALSVLLVFPVSLLFDKAPDAAGWTVVGGLLLHGASLAALPLLAWAAARSAVRASRAVLPFTQDQWMLSGPAPRWAVVPSLVYTLAMGLHLRLMVWASYFPFVFYATYLALWFLFNRWWLRRCRDERKSIAVLERTNDDRGGASYRLWGMVDGYLRARPVSIEQTDAAKGLVQLFLWDVLSTWSPVSGILGVSADDVGGATAEDDSSQHQEHR